MLFKVSFTRRASTVEKWICRVKETVEKWICRVKEFLDGTLVKCVGLDCEPTRNVRKRCLRVEKMQRTTLHQLSVVYIPSQRSLGNS
jgi:hypothetical protein